MKRVLTACSRLSTPILVLLLLIFWTFAPGWATAQTWYKTDATVVGWDAVTTLEGTTGPIPLPAGDVITYRVVLKPEGGSPEILGETDALTYAVQIPAEGRWLPGVAALRWVGGEMVGVSAISWSDGPTALPDPWGVEHWYIPWSPSGVRKQ